MKTKSITNYKERLEILRQNSIKTKLIELNQCKELIFQLKKQDTSSMTKSELYHHERKLNLQVNKKKILIQKLSILGYNADRRGRPTKDDSQKYKNTHIRMTCYFTTHNSKILKDLKEQGSIENISSFLNELLESYFALSKDGADDEKEN
ncbi:hypothetical protein [Clostridium drakei]|uniref:Uncharacterized protein n=1 Tax=Clostridium drakei TaxID=332101 RepID=A0A2U8DK48_9CLOT|nr:hypothetical protein [Clostridium drakei]AWI03109.1 hypothetical protein B9W14_00830 [Clostridium drakei]